MANQAITIYGQDYTEYRNEEENPVIDDFLMQLADTNSPLYQQVSKSISFRGKGQEKVDIYDGVHHRFSGIAGIFQVKNYRYDDKMYDIKVEIRSRMDARTAPSKPYFLATLLEAGVENLAFNPYNIPSSMEDLFAFLLVYLFRECLLKTHHLGLFKQYQRFENNDSRMRGTIDVARHIKWNAGLHNGKLAYSYRENTADNPFHHLLIHTYLELKKRFPMHVHHAIDSNLDSKVFLNNVMRNAPGYQKTNVRTLLRVNEKPIVQPYFQPYEEMRLVCIRILHNIGLSFLTNESDTCEVQGMLFYIPDLWECYLEQRLSRRLPEDMTMEAQKVVAILIGGTDKQEDAPKERLNARPDMVFSSRSENNMFMVLDAKYRPSWHHVLQSHTKLGGLNLTADYDKCIRDMNAIQAHATGVIFPVEIENKTEIKNFTFAISEYNQMDRFYLLPVYIPAVGKDISYREWRRLLEEQETLCFYNMIAYLKTEKKIKEAMRVYEEGMREVVNNSEIR